MPFSRVRLRPQPTSKSRAFEARRSGRLLEGRSIGRLFHSALGLFLFLSAGAAWAASVFSYSAEHTTKKSPEHVLSVLTAYGKTCDKGCPYYGPDLVEFVQLKEKRTRTSWYTWSYVSTTMKSVKYFNKVDLQLEPSGNFVMITRQLDDRDKDTIEELKRLTGREHSPAFDAGTTRFTVVRSSDGTTKVTQAMKLTASGMLAMFGGKIDKGMRDGAKFTFANIDK